MPAEAPKRTPEGSPAASATAGDQRQLATGRRIGDRYRLIAPLDRRRQIWKAAGPDGRLLALKTGAAALIEHEQRVLLQLKHPHIVGLVDTVETPAGQFLALEYLDGGDLVSLAGMPPEQWLGPLASVAEALGFLHARGLVYRDLKARHVRFDADGCAKLIDFGSVSPIGAPWDRVGTTPEMVDPRRGSGPVAPADDTYALACLLHEMLHGRLPAAGAVDPVPARLQPLDELVVSVLSADTIAADMDLRRFSTVIKWLLSERWKNE